MFRIAPSAAYRPSHLLCQGYQRGCTSDGLGWTLLGLQCHYPNEHVNCLKGPQWHAVLRLLGKDGEEVMRNLLVDEAIFVPVGSGFGNYYQISGVQKVLMVAARESLSRQ